MHLNYTKQFLKNFEKRISQNRKLDRKFQERLELFLQNYQSPLLADHKLTGAEKDLRAFSITGDIRVTYRRDGEEIYLVDIGTHNQVYR